MTIEWGCKPFAGLNRDELYAILKVRQEVFVVEQECAFLDADGDDQQAWHLCGWRSGQLAAYARIFAAGCVREQASIGRVMTVLECRGQGLGYELMNQSIHRLPNLIEPGPVWIGAQERLCGFYEHFGFVQTGERYLEDGIWHRGMQASMADLRCVQRT